MIEILVLRNVKQAKKLCKDFSWQMGLENFDEDCFSRPQETAQGFWTGFDRGIDVFKGCHLPEDIAVDLDR